jgi:WD repeat-containing protein 49
MWNFNNGQMLRRMHKNNSLETTDVCYIEMGSNQYIVAVGWDKQVTIFLEDNDSIDAEPVRILDARGTRNLVGHTDDISSVSFGHPNTLATSSLDGSIIIWNLESGYIKFVLREPELIIRPEEEKAVEKVYFVNTGPKLDGNVPPLISCHADGHLRIWNVIEGKMIHEVNCQVIEGEGLTTLATDDAGTMVFIGGSYGHLRIIDLHGLMYSCNHPEKSQEIKVIEFWRANLVGLTSCIYVDQHKMVLTGSKDAVIRLWSMKGEHVGTFGDMPWNFLDPSLSKLPREIQHAIDEEERANEHLTKQQATMKKKIINTWRTVSQEGTKPVVGHHEGQVGIMKVKATKAHIASLFKKKWEQEKNKADWQINPESVQIRNSKVFLIEVAILFI